MALVTSFTLVDWIILSVLLGAFLVGWITGIIRILTGFLSFVVAVALAGRFSDGFLDWLNRQWQVQTWFEGVLTKRLQLPPELAIRPSGPVPMETAMKWMGIAPVPGVYKEPLARQIVEWSANQSGLTVAEYLVQQIATGLLSAFAFVFLVFTLSFLITRLGRLLSDQIQAIPLVGTADRLLGGAALLFETTLILSIGLIWLVPTLTLYGAKGLGEAIDQAQLPSYFILFFEWTRGLLLGGGTRLWNG